MRKKKRRKKREKKKRKKRKLSTMSTGTGNLSSLFLQHWQPYFSAFVLADVTLQLVH
jgi:hypothetical protein